MNIYEKMGEIMKTVQYMSKDDKVEFGNTKYKALSEEKVTTVMRKAMIDNGLLVFPIEQSWSRTGQISHVDVKYRIVNIEKPDEYIDVVSCGDGADSQDKGSGKAMTYAYKYMWLRTFGIPTGEDPDKIASEQIDAEQNAKNTLITEKDKKVLENLCAKKGLKPGEFFNCWPKLTNEQYVIAVNKLSGMPDKK